MVQVEEIIQRAADYEGIREELASLDFVPRTDQPDFALWDHPGLEIIVLIKMYTGGRYESYNIVTYADMQNVNR
ncbi:hypothetical protein ASZ90_010729 [hydrocarbon metagenome]|uniref:Uncharacterized protein n=1 Tax=hydrocarbon metagenome TaxID=938273 RepID=A0A0W8FF71_9ZZZZ